MKLSRKVLKQSLGKIKKVPLWVLFAASILMMFISALSLRANNQNMIKLRDAVFIADEQDGDVEKALQELRKYVYSHMNTDLAPGENAIRPPIQLKYRYERLVAAEQANSQTGSGDIYQEAQAYCEKQHPSGFSGSNRLPCIREYLDTRGVRSTDTNVSIPEDLYKFDFASPRWSPDLAGWSLVIAVLLFAAFLVLFTAEYAIRLSLRKLS